MGEIVVAGRPNAVQYVRVSTDHQRYSIEIQQAVIADYAQKNGYNIIGTYVDEGRSGLTARDRASLIKLLHDVTDPHRKFSIILVLDVSRWGRFQDIDQHAAYEFICRDMGVRIEYASEIFANDDSVATSLLKHMKRVMAGEFSRELSSKIARAQLASAAKGFKQGGTATYGYRRLLVSEAGVPKTILETGDRKVLTSDRVLYIRGSKEEIEVVQRIYRLYVKDLCSMVTIARTLNLDNVSTGSDSQWNANKIKSILTNTLYTGVYSYNKTSAKMKSTPTSNPEIMWVKTKIGEGMISQHLFQRAQSLLKERSKVQSYSKKKLLSGLAKLLKDKGRLSVAIINGSRDIPSAETYAKHFGGLGAVYEAVGYRPDRWLQSYACSVPERFRKRHSRVQLLDGLRRLLAEKGELSTKLVNESDYTASAATYHLRFGSIQNAYAEIGYEPRRRQPGHPSYWSLNKDIAINGLKDLYSHHGYITTSLVDLAPDIPMSSWYRRNYGSFTNACRAAGIEVSLVEQITESRYRIMNRFRAGRPDANSPTRSKYRMVPDDELISGVRRIFLQHGYVTGELIDQDPELPRTKDIYGRYASLKHLYAKAGVKGKTTKKVRTLSA